jgi:hypothetical protein
VKVAAVPSLHLGLLLLLLSALPMLPQRTVRHAVRSSHLSFKMLLLVPLLV